MGHLQLQEEVPLLQILRRAQVECRGEGILRVLHICRGLDLRVIDANLDLALDLGDPG